MSLLRPLFLSRTGLRVIGGFALICSRAHAQEFGQCVLDSECPHGRQCIDLVCVPGTAGEHTVQPPTQSAPQSAETSPKVTPRPAATPAAAPSAPPPRPQIAYRPWEQQPARDRELIDNSAKALHPQSTWYGGPLIATYAGTAVVGTLTLAQNGNAPLLALALFSSPTVHWANRKLGKGFLSLFMQPVFAGGGALLGASIDEKAVLGGALFGYATWALIDVAALAYKNAPAKVDSAGFGVHVYRLPKGAAAEVVGAW